MPVVNPLGSLTSELDILHHLLLHLRLAAEDSADPLVHFIRGNVLKIDLRLSTVGFQLGIFECLRDRISQERGAIAREFPEARQAACRWQEELF